LLKLKRRLSMSEKKNEEGKSTFPRFMKKTLKKKKGRMKPGQKIIRGLSKDGRGQPSCTKAEKKIGRSPWDRGEPSQKRRKKKREEGVGRKSCGTLVRDAH